MNAGLNQEILSNPPFLVLAIAVSIWTMAWKAIALWRAAKLSQRNWFIALLILFPINLLGIIEIIFLFFFAKEKLTIKEIKGWFVKK